MNRVAAVVVTLLVVAGSVPAAATLVDGTQADGTESGAEPGADFAGVVGVQQAEVDNEVAERSLAQRFERATSNDSKARVVAEEQARLQERLDELESQKARLERARENGSIGQGEYRARLAGLAAEIRAVERQANRTADVADSVPPETLRDNGANASAVREVAQHANRTGGGDVAAAARSVAGEGVGNGLRGPPNASERGPPDDAGPPDHAGPPDDDRDGTEVNETETEEDEPGGGDGPGEGDGAGDAPGNGPPDRTPGPPETTEVDDDGTETENEPEDDRTSTATDTPVDDTDTGGTDDGDSEGGTETDEATAEGDDETGSDDGSETDA